MKPLRPPLAWALAASVVLTLASSWLPKPAPVAAAQNVESAWPTLAASPVHTQTAQSVAAPLPAELPAAPLEPAEADPFAPPAPPAPPMIQAPPAPPPAPVVPMAPPLRYRFLGQLTDPAGQRWVYLGKDQQELVATVGTALEDGYVVTAVEPGVVRLRHQATDTGALIEIPSQDAAP